MRIIDWTDEAVANLDSIIKYVAEFNPSAAVRLAERLIATVDRLSEFSDRGRPATGDHREMTVIWPYVIRYRVEQDRVIIVRIRHGARDDG